MIKIIVVEDNEMVRAGVVELLNDQPDMQVVGDTEDGIKTLALLETSIQADIVLTDLNMEGMDGIQLTEQISARHPIVKVIILTMHLRSEFIKRGFDAGAMGFVLKSGNISDLYSTIRRVFEGEQLVTAGL
jgi:DNA-binding NarL/FixJ family response regulator